MVTQKKNTNSTRNNDMIHCRTTKPAVSLAQHHVKSNIYQLSFHVQYLKILLSKRKQKETGWRMKRAQLKHLLPQGRQQTYHHTCRQTLTQRNQSSSYQESLEGPPPRAQSKVFYLTSTSVTYISPGTKNRRKAWSQNLRNTNVSMVHLLVDLCAQRCAP